MGSRPPRPPVPGISKSTCRCPSCPEPMRPTSGCMVIPGIPRSDSIKALLMLSSCLVMLRCSFKCFCSSSSRRSDSRDFIRPSRRSVVPETFMRSTATASLSLETSIAALEMRSCKWPVVFNMVSSTLGTTCSTVSRSCAMSSARFSRSAKLVWCR